MVRILSASILFVAAFCSPSSAEDDSSASRFQKEVKPLLANYCYRCHNDKKASADLKLHKLNSDLVNGPDAETWHDVLNRMNVGEMPPEDEPQPSAAEHQKIVKWITAELKLAAAKKRSTGGRAVLRRLTRYEYANTMRDLLGVNLDFAADLPPEPASADGFQNNGASLGMSPLQLEYYLKSARLGLAKAIVTGEKPAVCTHHAEKSASAKGRRKNLVVGNRLGPGNLFLARIDKFPREGEFSIRIKAGAGTPEGNAHPKLSVEIGVRADVLSPVRVVGESDISASLDQPAVYEFRGRIEDFPPAG